jgi:hypothetical protein
MPWSSAVMPLSGKADSQQRPLAVFVSCTRIPVVAGAGGSAGLLRPAPLPFTEILDLASAPLRSRIPLMPSWPAAGSLYLYPLVPSALHNVALAGTPASMSSAGEPLVSAKTHSS